MQYYFVTLNLSLDIFFKIFLISLQWFLFFVVNNFIAFLALFSYLYLTLLSIFVLVIVTLNYVMRNECDSESCCLNEFSKLKKTLFLFRSRIWFVITLVLDFQKCRKNLHWWSWPFPYLRMECMFNIAVSNINLLFFLCLRVFVAVLFSPSSVLIFNEICFLTFSKYFLLAKDTAKCYLSVSISPFPPIMKMIAFLKISAWFPSVSIEPT